MIIQLILTAVVFVLALYFLQHRNTRRLRAGKKILFLLFVVFSVIAIIQPNFVTDAAHLVGVGRGVDLLVYGLVLAFVFVVINVYLKFKDYEQRINKLAREVAIAEAVNRENRHY